MPLIYKYRSVGNNVQLQQLRVILETGQFWFPKAAEVNDPFEFLCTVQLLWDIPRTAEAFAIVEMHVNPSIEFSAALIKARTVLGGLSPSRLQERQRELSLNLWKMFTQTAAICCLSGTARSVLMWSHYADGHRGVAIEVSVPDEHVSNHMFGQVLKVAYSDAVPQLDPLSLVDENVAKNDDLVGQLFLQKSKCWEYEQEYRVLRFHGPMNTIASHQAPLPKGCTITRVILGCAMPPDIRGAVESMVRRIAPSVDIAYAVPADEATFAVVIASASDVCA